MPTSATDTPRGWPKSDLDKMCNEAFAISVAPNKYRKRTRRIARFAWERICEELQPHSDVLQRRLLRRIHRWSRDWESHNVAVLIHTLSGVLEERAKPWSAEEHVVSEIMKLAALLAGDKLPKEEIQK
jgi:hypothetical protein